MSQTDLFNSTELPGLLSADTDKIMAAIAFCQTALMCKIDDLQADVNHLRYDIEKIKDRTSEVERWVGIVEDTVHTTEIVVRALQQQVKIQRITAGGIMWESLVSQKKLRVPDRNSLQNSSYVISFLCLTCPPALL